MPKPSTPGDFREILLDWATAPNRHVKASNNEAKNKEVKLRQAARCRRPTLSASVGHQDWTEPAGVLGVVCPTA